MTSTNINVGLGDGRSSSRVLKPPGGGHSDIFGIRDEKPAMKKPVLPTNNIIISENPAREEEIKSIEEEKKESDENTVQEETEKSPSVQRVRVPPGGYSTALW